MTKYIPINFIGGTYGNFLARLCGLVFLGKMLPPKTQLTINGTWHLPFVTDSDICFFAPRHMYWSKEQIAHHYSVPLLSYDKVISITYDSVLEQALSLYNWSRVGDAFPFVADELLFFNREECIAEYTRRHSLTTSTRKVVNDIKPIRGKHLDYILGSLYKTNTVSEVDLICKWIPPDRLSAWNYESVQNAEWLSKVKTVVVPFSIEALFDDDKALLAINNLSNVLGLPKLASDEEILELLRYFRDNIVGLPNLTLVQQKFNSILNIHGDKLDDLYLHDKILLLTMLQIHFSIPREKLYLTAYPTSTVEFATIINELTH